MLNQRELETLNAIVRGWDENEAKLPGNLAYQDVFDLLDKLGAERPERLTAWLKSIEEQPNNPNYQW